MTRSGTSTPGRRARGFTLIEMLVTMMIIGLAMTLVFNIDNLVPRARLAATGTAIASDLQRMRSHALFRGQELVFAYDLDRERYEAYYPVEVDQEGRVLGPGRTTVLDPKPVQDGMALESIRLADGSIRELGVVEFRVNRLGRIPPHRVLVVNPEFAETERLWVQVDGISNDSRLLDELPEGEEEITDAHFR